MCIKREFEMNVSKTEVVAAALPMQDHWLPLSNLDLLLPPVDVGVFFCYKTTNELSFGHIVGVLKKALAQTLVSYYAFAAVLVKNSAGEPELLCNNSGVDFVEAYGGVELKDLNLYNPDESVEGKLVPERKRGVLAVQTAEIVQKDRHRKTFKDSFRDRYECSPYGSRNSDLVTQLKCGGVVVAATFAHQVADAYSANMFLVSWAEMAQFKPLSLPPPSFRRSLLFPRRPGAYHLSVDNMYIPISALPPPQDDDNDDNQAAISRIYYITSDRINKIQSLANIDTAEDDRRSKLVAFSAYLWKTIAAGKNSDKNCKLGLVVDGRSRLIDGDENEAKLIASYFGNVLSIPFGEIGIGKLNEKPLNWVAREVHAFLKCAVTKEHFLGLIDWVEERRPEMGVSRIYAARVTEEEPAVVVSSGKDFPVRRMDFGWGLPVFGSYHFPWGGKSGYVMPMVSPKGNGDWVVYMHLLRGQLELIESTAAHVFSPITSDYLLSMT
ncbi:hypothetical protein BUALT_Bualt18G0106000 [Buddleja alternifolia]|uniref:Uncharacterized protein n=1 Tax=Buddleja alternifolia TaxID=168488 RepID=A0AAV6WCL5_9LAMI|nr:hypothetical protein BUALT_Bualt18G0106000 [Buddleja alternifolia]